jgi:hypothetical protein
MLNISKNPKKRRRALAIIAAQIIFNTGSLKYFHDKESLISFLKNYTDEVSTPYGKICGRDLAKIIENEEIDLNELNIKLQEYQRRKVLREIRRQREEDNFIANIVSDYISSNETDSMESIIEALKNIKEEKIFFMGYNGKMRTLKDVIQYLENSRGRSGFLELIRKRVRKKELDERDRRELEEYLNKIGKDYDVPVEVVELVYYHPNFYAFKVRIGNDTYLDEFEGTLHELKEFLGDIVVEHAPEMKELVEIAYNNMRAQVERVSGFADFLNEIDNHVHDLAIITFTTESNVESWDISRRKNGFLTFGASPSLWPKFYDHFVKSISKINFSSVILRSFTDKIHAETGLPIKELRGYRVWLHKHEFKFEQISLEELVSAMNTDYESGLRLPPEPAVIYCGSDGQISSDELIESVKRDVLEELRNSIKIILKETISKTDVFRGLADLVYELYIKYPLNPKEFKKVLTEELQKLATEGSRDPTGKILYYIEYSEELPIKLSETLYGKIE